MPCSYGSVLFDSVRFGSVRFGSVRFGYVRLCSVTFGYVRFGSVLYPTAKILRTVRINSSIAHARPSNGPSEPEYNSYRCTRVAGKVSCDRL